MNLKSLLIGSAAALVAAPAFAADVIIAEPEPVEYVEVCDVAGAGFFYIPGSRTCLRIGGLVRHELQFGDDASGRFSARGRGSRGSGTDGENDGIDSLVRANLTISTFTETALGDLTSNFELRSNDINSGDGDFVLNDETGELNNNGFSDNGSTFVQSATLGLGGLLLGMTDSLYDGGIAGEFDSLGGDRVHTIRYTADLGAFSAALAVEAERSFDSRFNYVPNVVGMVSGTLGPVTVDLFAAYDDEDEFAIFLPAGSVVNGVVRGGLVDIETGEDEFALKARLGADFGPAAIALAGTYNSGANYYDNGYEYSVAASATFGIGEKASFTFGGQYFANSLGVRGGFVTPRPLDAAGNPIGPAVVTTDAVSFENDQDAFSIGANVNYEIVDGFDVTAAVTYRELDTDDVLDDDEDGNVFGFIRFDRSF